MTPPSELPAEIAGPSAWYGPDVAARTDWIHTLGDEEIAEIESAVRGLGESGLDPTSLCRERFPLPSLAPRLGRILAEVQTGRGFVLLRGLPVREWGPRRSALAFLGLGVHLGNFRPQNAQGHLLGHVRDQGLSSRDPNVRIYQTRERQNYHTDSCDVVGLLCLHPARSGGYSSLVSSVTIFNELRRRGPELAKILFEPVETDRRGEVPPGRRPFFRIPVFNWHAGLLTTIYHRAYIESARRFADVPPLTPAQTAALDAFDGLANDPALHFFMEFRAGDIQLVCNHSLLHDRTAFEDWPEPERRRHLLRLWLAPPDARPLPAVFADRYGILTPGNRGGIRVAGSGVTIPWEPGG
jgi:Taurine catabolism dioxygenase TauD, TfdA family